MLLLTICFNRVLGYFSFSQELKIMHLYESEKKMFDACLLGVVFDASCLIQNCIIVLHIYKY